MTSRYKQNGSISRGVSAWLTIVGWIVFFLLLFVLFNRIVNNM
ncbi:MAG: hypothetical protein QG652_586, partial [Pseudomonadota bacterium]|nr:hypothetical protein [Pseudomonadota bacterium]